MSTCKELRDSVVLQKYLYVCIHLNFKLAFSFALKGANKVAQTLQFVNQNLKSTFGMEPVSLRQDGVVLLDNTADNLPKSNYQFRSSFTSRISCTLKNKALIQRIRLNDHNIPHIEFRICFADPKIGFYQTRWERSIQTNEIILDTPRFDYKFILEIRFSRSYKNLEAIITNSLEIFGIGKCKRFDIATIPWSTILYLAGDSYISEGTYDACQLVGCTAWRDSINTLWEISCNVLALEKSRNMHISRPKIECWDLILKVIQAFHEYEDISFLKRIIDLVLFLTIPSDIILNELEANIYRHNRDTLFSRNVIRPIGQILNKMPYTTQQKLLDLIFYNCVKTEDIKELEKYDNRISLMHQSTFEELRSLEAPLNVNSMSHFKRELKRSTSKSHLIRVLNSFCKNTLSDPSFESFEIDPTLYQNKVECLELYLYFIHLASSHESTLRRLAWSCAEIMWLAFPEHQTDMLFDYLMIISDHTLLEELVTLCSFCSQLRQPLIQFLLDFLISRVMDYQKKEHAAIIFSMLAYYMDYGNIAHFIARCLMAPSNDTEAEDLNHIVLDGWDIDLEKSVISANVENQDDIFSYMSGLLLLISQLCTSDYFIISLVDSRVSGTIIKMCFESMNWGIIEIRHISENIVSKLERSGINTSVRPQLFNILGMNQFRQAKIIADQESKIVAMDKTIELLIAEVNTLKKSISKLSRKLNRSSSSSSSRDDLQEYTKRSYKSSLSRSSDMIKVEEESPKIVYSSSDLEIPVQRKSSNNGWQGLFKRFKKKIKSSKSEEAIK